MNEDDERYELDDDPDDLGVIERPRMYKEGKEDETNTTDDNVTFINFHRIRRGT